jgi:hypothetical protein
MPKETDPLPRRDFLKRAAQAAAAAAVSGGIARAAAPQNDKAALADNLPTRAFGKTGVELPILGFGGAALPREWGNPLSLEDRVKLVRYAYDRGLRYFDTAGNYMESQTILGQALKGLRDNVYLATKVETTVAAEVRSAVEKSLKELQTDYLNAILIHGTPGLEQMNVEQAMKIHGEVVKLRDEGLTKFVGFSAHSYFEKALALVSTGGSTRNASSNCPPPQSGMYRRTSGFTSSPSACACRKRSTRTSGRFRVMRRTPQTTAHFWRSSAHERWTATRSRR